MAYMPTHTTQSEIWFAQPETHAVKSSRISDLCLSFQTEKHDMSEMELGLPVEPLII